MKAANARARQLTAGGQISRFKPTDEGKAWVNYDKGRSVGLGDGGLYFTAVGDKAGSHDEVYRQNPRLEEAVGTKNSPKAEIMDCSQGPCITGESRESESTKQRQTQYQLQKEAILEQIREELHCQKSTTSVASKRTVCKDRPTKGAWVQYEGYCFTANGDKAWSHDEVYRQNVLLELAVGTKDDPKAEIMDVTQGSGAKVSGEATKERQAQYKANCAIFEQHVIASLRFQKRGAFGKPPK